MYNIHSITYIVNIMLIVEMIIIVGNGCCLDMVRVICMHYNTRLYVIAIIYRNSNYYNPRRYGN